LSEVVARRRPGETLLVLFLGSTIGNIDRPGAAAILREVRRLLLAGDRLLLGADLEKPEERMLLAYDDPTGVTASFNLNLLGRINRELGGNFQLRNFAHEARYHRPERRIEMHLRSLCAQRVAVEAAGVEVELGRNETIWTEASHKFLLHELPEMARAAGFRSEARWVDQEWPFAEALWMAQQ
jgi:uncharacterized SAM-dependent methyltransferase